jgi:phosphatidylglycerol---prolipoprotein diacylglyceryl transferase
VRTQRPPKGDAAIVEIAIDPTILRIGAFSLEWHGVLGAIGILVGVMLAMTRWGAHGLPVDRLTNMALVTILSGIVGARLFHVIDYWQYYSANPLQILAINQGGLAVYGALVCGFVGAIGFLLITRMPMGKLLDLGTPPMFVGIAIGRIGCLINGDSWGAPTGGNWGLVYTNPNARMPAALIGVPTQPFPVYELVWDFAVAAVIWWLSKRVRLDGRLVVLGMAMYAVARFGLNYFRQEQIVFAGLQQAQIISLAIVAVSIPLFAAVAWRSREKLTAPDPDQAG